MIVDDATPKRGLIHNTLGNTFQAIKKHTTLLLTYFCMKNKEHFCDGWLWLQVNLHLEKSKCLFNYYILIFCQCEVISGTHVTTAEVLSMKN